MVVVALVFHPGRDIFSEASLFADSPLLRLLNENSDVIDTSLTSHENRRVNITCDVSANPTVDGADIRWTKGETLVHTGASFVIDPIQRSHAGDYKCHATNQMLPSGKSPLEGSGMKSVQLLVLCKFMKILYLHLLLHRMSPYCGSVVCELNNPTSSLLYFSILTNKLSGPV